MSKWIRNATLAGLFAVGVGGVVSVSSPTALAYTQKAKAKAKAGDPAPGKGTIIIKPDAKGRFRLSVKNGDGKTLLMTAGNGFATEEDARAAIEEIKGIMAAGKVTVEKGEEK